MISVANAFIEAQRANHTAQGALRDKALRSAPDLRRWAFISFL